MRSRITVAVIGIPLLYLVLLVGVADALPWALAVSGATSIACLEMSRMLRPLGPWVLASLVPVALSPLLAWRMAEPGIFLALLATPPLIIIFQSLSVPRRDQTGALLATLAPVLYIAPSAGLVVIIRQADEGFGLVLLLIAAVFANDTGAFFTGRAIGRHKLAPRISPNKSIEGLVGGVALGTFVLWFGHYLVRTADEHLVLAGWEALGIGLAVALATPTGDLFESLVKRAVGTKDSGHFLGEHGGAMDRLDALLLAIPVMYVGLFFAGAL